MEQPSAAFDFGLTPSTSIATSNPNASALRARSGTIYNHFPPPTPPLSSTSGSPKRVAKSPLRRKPLPRASTLISPPPEINWSAGGRVIALGEDQTAFARIDSIVTPPESASIDHAWTIPPTEDADFPVRDLDQFPRGLSAIVSPSPGEPSRADLASATVLEQKPAVAQATSHGRMVSDPTHPRTPVITKATPAGVQRSVTMPTRPGHGPTTPPSRSPQRRVSKRVAGTPPAQRPGLASASNKLTSFFGWKGSSPAADASPSTIFDQQPPRMSPSAKSSASMQSKSIPRAIDIPKANAALQISYFGSAGFPQAPLTPAISIKMEELEEELREISTELACSIRREMELEEEVERLQLESAAHADANRRTSDYYSDSGTSSVRYPGSDAEKDSAVKIKRRSEFERAQSKLELSQKLQEERGKRTVMEHHIHSLEEHIRTIESHGSLSSAGRIQELETALGDNRRRLQEERRHKANFEDLLDALRGDLLQHRNERDNLRDEIVPQLRARVEGLEAEATNFQKLTYENARMQQELHALRTDRRGAVSSIPEEGDASTVSGLTRSASLSKGLGGLTRANSSSKDRESRESLADRVKDIELQRDALHRALKSLLDRQKFQTREHEKRVKALESERDRALEAQSPHHRGYELEVKDLRFEINELRRRADDALEQKWQCEKGLGGLKKDLDRAEQETSSLRHLLHEKEIPLPFTSSSSLKADTQATSASLERAYTDLRRAQALSISHIREVKGLAPTTLTSSAQTEEALALLLQTTSAAEAERDYAQRQADAYRAQAASLLESSSFVEGENAGLAEQLRTSAKRVDGLASQVRSQLDCNADLRTRLSEAVGKGEREQKASAARIDQLTHKLKGLEDGLVVEQQRSEDAVQEHEDDVRALRRSSLHDRLHRLRASPATGAPPPSSTEPGKPSPVLGLGIRRSGPPSASLSPESRSPGWKRRISGAPGGPSDAGRTEALQARVRELERALRDAEHEMGEVVQKMNRAQIEVMELQSARDEAGRATGRLEEQVVAEKERYQGFMRFMPGSA